MPAAAARALLVVVLGLLALGVHAAGGAKELKCPRGEKQWNVVNCGDDREENFRLVCHKEGDSKPIDIYKTIFRECDKMALGKRGYVLDSVCFPQDVTFWRHEYKTRFDGAPFDDDTHVCEQTRGLLYKTAKRRSPASHHAREEL
ncbi:unnamed protein product [Pedinophyceae sp. YPF-701]|nr:unnamed protein product [Pedinophyceae sp. YPF-701]